MRRALVLMLALAACDNTQALEAPDPTWARMLSQRRADPFERSSVFPDGKVMQDPPAGAIPRDLGAEAPPPLTRELLVLGRERFEVICATCHGIAADGESVVATKMELRRPPSLQEARYRAQSREEIFATITSGYGMMPSYAPMLDVRERWAVIAYLRTLQLSQHVRVADLPPHVRAELVRAMSTSMETAP